MPVCGTRERVEALSPLARGRYCDRNRICNSNHTAELKPSARSLGEYAVTVMTAPATAQQNLKPSARSRPLADISRSHPFAR